MILETSRLTLHRWAEEYRHAFAAMHADPELMADYGGTIPRAESDASSVRTRF